MKMKEGRHNFLERIIDFSKVTKEQISFCTFATRNLSERKNKPCRKLQLIHT